MRGVNFASQDYLSLSSHPGDQGDRQGDHRALRRAQRRLAGAGRQHLAFGRARAQDRRLPEDGGSRAVSDRLGRRLRRHQGTGPFRRPRRHGHAVAFLPAGRRERRHQQHSSVPPSGQRLLPQHPGQDPRQGQGERHSGGDRGPVLDGLRHARTCRAAGRSATNSTRRWSSTSRTIWAASARTAAAISACRTCSARSTW